MPLKGKIRENSKNRQKENPVTFREANDLIDRYIHFYNHERIQLKTGVAPMSLRHSA